jgi:hypothetical protein
MPPKLAKTTEEIMAREINPMDTPRAMAFSLWMQAPNPMVTFFKTMDVTNLVRISRKKNLKIPDDLSVICTDESGNPSLGIGNLSWDFQYLARMIDEQLNNYVPATYPLPHILDPRESTAPPRQSPKTFFS